MLENKLLTITIPIEHAEERLDQALAKLLPEYSRTQIKQWIDDGLIQINGKCPKAKTKVVGGEIVNIIAKPRPDTTFEPQDIPLCIIHEDESLLIINKPAGLVVHPGAGNADKTLLNALLHHIPELKQLPRAGILHRIDKNTSGLLVVAKTAAALKHLSHQLKKHTLSREYQAIVYGHIISGATINAPIDRHPIHRKRMAIVETGKEAITHYRVAEKYRAQTRLNIKLETGRTHQIRVHMSYIHHPIVGDFLYGGLVKLSKGMQTELIDIIRQFKRQALHAFALEFTHPETHELMRFAVEPPEDMQQLIAALRKDYTYSRGK